MMQNKQLTRTPEVNTDLDYALCERLGKTMDELDSISLTIVENLRESLWKTWISEGIAEELL
jgi:hypothetical protein